MFKLCASSIVSWANYFLYQIEKKLDVGFDLVPSFYQRKRRNSWFHLIANISTGRSWSHGHRCRDVWVVLLRGSGGDVCREIQIVREGHIIERSAEKTSVGRR